MGNVSKRVSVIAAVVAAAALVGTRVVAVQAEEVVDADLAVVVGTATATPPIQLTFGGGSFSFSSTVCAMSSVNAPPEATETEPPLPGVLDAEPNATCTAMASGSYGNLVCGTGIAAGSGTLTEGSGSDTYSIVEFEVSFFAGVGLLAGEAYESESDGGGLAGQSRIAGEVDIVPVPPLPGAPACASNLDVAALLATDA